MSDRFSFSSINMDGSKPIPSPCEKHRCRYSSSRAGVVVSALLIVSFFIGFSFLLFFEFDCVAIRITYYKCPMKPKLFLLIHNYARGDKACFARA